MSPPIPVQEGNNAGKTPVPSVPAPVAQILPVWQHGKEGGDGLAGCLKNQGETTVPVLREGGVRLDPTVGDPVCEDAKFLVVHAAHVSRYVSHVHVVSRYVSRYVVTRKPQHVAHLNTFFGSFERRVFEGAQKTGGGENSGKTQGANGG